MHWNVIFHHEFEQWFKALGEDVQNSIAAHLMLLKTLGPNLGRPKVDTLTNSKLKNLKELRVQHKGKPWRILFIFDPARNAILLVGGNKTGDKRWYKENIPIAEKRYSEYLKQKGT
jgi:hypothetical protein